MSLKKKLVSVTVVVGLVSGVGLTFASASEGSPLRQWYNNLFGNTQQSILADNEASANEAFQNWAANSEQLKTGAGQRINQTMASELTRVGAEIMSTKDAHIASLDADKRELLDNMNYQVYQYIFLEGYFAIQNQGDAALGAVRQSFTDYTSSTGQAAVNELTTELTSAKDSAVSELEAAIQQAKEELSAQLALEEQISRYNLERQIEFKLRDLRDSLTTIINRLVTDQQNIITAKAIELEEEARASLDEVMGSIND
ncbi:hypothetical protein [Sutcliffiella rhizosphaerae]|uniref:Uncharacterized protein n=1 Tax=Sutcliffiella rhizosphaerae TaxID=2880967 RepID=A0ABM8YQG5_9BACI|nr:hypothetical protein [Sutcliffiella rhizosphaerae]CAG9622182.1 hypothetical protein BACCIP111883_02973 [Sutcliffiella rhizosphaerae]